MSGDVFLHVTSGNGPVECRIAVGLMVAHILDAAAERGVSSQASMGAAPDAHGPKSAVVHLSGAAADDVATLVVGTVRFVFKSPVRKGHQRQNWFVGIQRIDDPAAVASEQIHADDVRIETLRAGGPGGQHVNTTDSAVRAVHVPTGVAVVSRDERSQHRNRATALLRLQGMLDVLAHRANEDRKRDLFRTNKELERGNEVLVIRPRI
jgi:peptide chain release factor